MVCCAIQSRWVGGTWHMTVAYEGWVFLRRLGCYGETAACRANRVGRNVRLGASFASCQPMQRLGDYVPKLL
jgi:hypothetical protein